MMYFSIILSTFLVLSASGCTSKQIPEDPCKYAPKTCWGQAGTSPSDNKACQSVITCWNWEITEKK